MLGKQSNSIMVVHCKDSLSKHLDKKVWEIIMNSTDLIAAIKKDNQKFWYEHSFNIKFYLLLYNIVVYVINPETAPIGQLYIITNTLSQLLHQTKLPKKCVSKLSTRLDGKRSLPGFKFMSKTFQTFT